MLSAVKKFLYGVSHPANKLKMLVPGMNYILCHDTHSYDDLRRLRMEFPWLYEAK